MMTSTNSRWFYWCVGEATGRITAANEEKWPCGDLLHTPASAFRASFSSTPGVKQTSARSIHQGVVHTLAALIMGKCFDKVYLSPTFLYYFVFEELLAWMQRSHRAQYGTCAEPPHVGAANRPCY